jgi:hypothetical protein
MDDLIKLFHKMTVEAAISASLERLKRQLADDGVDVEFSFKIKDVNVDVINKRAEEHFKRKTNCEKNEKDIEQTTSIDVGNYRITVESENNDTAE